MLLWFDGILFFSPVITCNHFIIWTFLVTYLFVGDYPDRSCADRSEACSR